MDKKVRAKLIPLIQERAIREYFLNKMWIRLTRMSKQNQINNRMYEYTKWQYDRFEDKIGDINLKIDKIVPKGTHHNEMPRIIITD